MEDCRIKKFGGELPARNPDSNGAMREHMKIIVMSDTHIGRVSDGFRKICDRYCEDADLVIHLGDWDRAPILDYMEQYPLEAVAGNMDDPLIRERLPSRRIITLGDRRIALVHGWGPGSDLRQRLKREFSDVDAVLFGHTHQELQLYDDGVFWFNPGSISHGRGQFAGSLGILTIDEDMRAEIIPL